MNSSCISLLRIPFFIDHYFQTDFFESSSETAIIKSGDAICKCLDENEGAADYAKGSYQIARRKFGRPPLSIAEYTDAQRSVFRKFSVLSRTIEARSGTFIILRRHEQLAEHSTELTAASAHMAVQRVPFLGLLLAQLVTQLTCQQKAEVLR